jgi:hypothetical protein
VHIGQHVADPGGVHAEIKLGLELVPARGKRDVDVAAIRILAIIKIHGIKIFNNIINTCSCV